MQDGRKVREPDRGLSETLELVSPCKTNQRSLENTDLIRKELEMILEWDVLPAKIPEFPTVRRRTLRMNSPMLVPSVQAREGVVRQQKVFTQGWDTQQVRIPHERDKVKPVDYQG